MNKKIIINTMKIGLIMLFIVILVYGYINKDVLFRKVTIKTFPDNCSETFVNDILVTRLCNHSWIDGDTDWIYGLKNQIRLNGSNSIKR